MGAGARVRTDCPWYNTNYCSYPGEYNMRHIHSYCSTNNQNNSKGCAYFPQPWHNCGNCGDGVYDTEKFCPGCGAQQY